MHFTLVLCVPLSQHLYILKSWIARWQAEIGEDLVGSYSGGQQCIMSKIKNVLYVIIKY